MSGLDPPVEESLGFSELEMEVGRGMLTFESCQSTDAMSWGEEDRDDVVQEPVRKTLVT